MSKKARTMAAAAGGESVAVCDDPVSEMQGEELSEAEIAIRAYSYWEERGCVGGSAEDDWYRAVDELRQEHQA
jgi:hypothetical protein